MKTLLVMAAGTGGHVFPGLAIADAMKARGWKVSWLGTTHGMERDLVPRHGVEMDLIEFSGVRGKGLRHSLAGVLKMLRAFAACRAVLKRRRPDVVLGMGGYVTVPGGVMARLSGIPLALVNADAALLLSNRTLLPAAESVLFGFPSAVALGHPKAVVTGNPVRREILALPEPEVRFQGREGPLRLMVVGGSLGAKVLNETVPQALARLPQASRPVVVHQSGKQHVEALRAAYAQAGVQAEVVDFIDDMAARYREADLVLCRAGAITVSELSAAGVASMLVPLMVSTTSHQKDNAEWMAAQDAAIHLPQKELNPERLAELLASVTRERCRALAVAARAQGRRDASEAIAQVLEELVKT